MRENIRIEDIRKCLSYDTEEKRFLSIPERCSLHKNQVRILDNRPVNIPITLEIKINNKLDEIKENRWKRPNYKYKKENGELKKEYETI